MRMSPIETICMKCQNLFSGKNKKNINLSSAECAQKIVQVKKDLTTSTKEINCCQQKLVDS